MSAASGDMVQFSSKDNYAWELARQFIEGMHADLVSKNPALKLCKKWRRDKKGEAAAASVGHSMIDSSTRPSSSITSKTWACAQCTFANPLAASQCEMCTKPKPSCR